MLGFPTRDETFTVELAPGMTVTSEPPPVNLDSRFGSLTVTTTREGNKVIVKSRLALKVDRVKPADYAAFKQFCAAVDQALTPRLVVQP